MKALVQHDITEEHQSKFPTSTLSHWQIPINVISPSLCRIYLAEFHPNSNLLAPLSEEQGAMS
jgi:hypothetical protein